MIKTESPSLIGKFWAAFALFLIFSLWPSFRPELGNFSIHTALFLIPIIILLILPFGLVSFKNIGKYLFLGLFFLNIILLSSLINGVFNQSLFIKWMVSLFIMLLLATTIKKREDIILILKSIAIAVGAICLYGLLTWTGSGNPINPFKFATRNALSNWTPAVFPIVLIFSLFLSPSWKGKIFWGITFFIIALAQFYTLNRSAWIIIVLSIILVFLTFKNKKKLIIYFLILCFGFYLVGSSWLEFGEVEKRFSSISSMENVLTDNSVIDRFQQGQKTLVIFSRNPLLGIGLGQYLNYDAGIDMRYKFEESHSIYLNVLAETGFLGFFSLFLIIFLIFSSLWRIYKKSKNPNDRYLAIMLMLSIVVILVRGTTTHEIQFIPITPLILGLSIKFITIINSENKRKNILKNNL